MRAAAPVPRVGNPGLQRPEVRLRGLPTAAPQRKAIGFSTSGTVKPVACHTNPGHESAKADFGQLLPRFQPPAPRRPRPKPVFPSPNDCRSNPPDPS